ncbi:hypothetical protein NEMIN01_1695 [Nematocida minor]|uniref:uncharacterized protein n=1 Tax=Nematocida minor TaxID=1912983 RepID=UPI00221EAE7E|nr:uncharacterized protein NEMIN01_1695 [Nematocida minor]KAI5191840.1 hypothetical protein NEMIN01_1695 [Nematocida minor]
MLMKYHSLTIRPDNIYVQESIEHDTIIKSVSLTPSVSDSTKRSSLVVCIDGSEATLCNLLTNTMESKILNIPLKKGVRLEIRTEGENELDVLFLEIESHEIEEDAANDATSYKVIKVSENAPYKIEKTEIAKILNISISSDGESALKDNSSTKVTIKDGSDIIKITDLETGVKECEVVDIEIDNREVDIEVEGPGSVDILVLESKEQDNCCNESDACCDENDACCIQEITEEENMESENVSQDNATPLTSAIDSSSPSEKCPEEQEKSKSIKKRKMCTEEKTDEESPKKVHTEEELNETEKTAAAAEDWEKVVEKEDVNVSTLSEGIGRLIGKRSVISTEYSVTSGGDKNTFQEKVMVRRVPEHVHLKYFSDLIRGSREGAVFKADIKTASKSTEVVLNVGKLE